MQIREKPGRDIYFGAATGIETYAANHHSLCISSLHFIRFVARIITLFRSRDKNAV